MRSTPLLIALAVSGQAHEPTTSPATEPTTAPVVATRPATTRSADDVRGRMLGYLRAEYERLLSSSDGVERAFGVISVIRLPGSEVNDRLLEMAATDPVAPVRVVAWQGLLSRARVTTPEQFGRWARLTDRMIAAGDFKGTTRADLFRFLALIPPTPERKRLFLQCVDETNLREPEDIALIQSLGDCLGAWGSPDLVQELVKRLSSADEAFRAEYILHGAGASVPWAGERMDLGSNRMWAAARESWAAYWRKKSGLWKELAQPDVERRRRLAAGLLGPVDLETPLDPDDPAWRKELELGRLERFPLEVVFVVDATGSMQKVLDLLKRQLASIRAGLALIAVRPRIGITAYRDIGDEFVTRTCRLTDQIVLLDSFLTTLRAKGGGDRPEAVLEALVACVREQPWTTGADVRKAVVLMTDAPPHAETTGACIKIAEACAGRKIVMEVVKVSADLDQSDMAIYDKLCESAGTTPLTMPLPELAPLPFEVPDIVERHPWTKRYFDTAKAVGEDSPDRQILRRLMERTVSPKFADRVGPLVNVVMALSATTTPETRGSFDTIRDVPPARGVRVAPDRTPDPQAR